MKDPIPFKLIPDAISKDTVECVETLLKHALTGRMLGIAYVAMYKDRKYVVNTAGECHRNRVFTRGMLADLHESLSIKDDQ